MSPAEGLDGAVDDTVAASIPVKAAPDIAGKVLGNLASGKVPEVKSLALVELVTFAVLAVISPA
jgi:hypothetical protein